MRKEARTQAEQAPAGALEETKRTFVELREVVRQLHRSGVTLLAGTDLAGPRIPGFTLHDELVLLVEAGMTRMEALQTATITPARLFEKGEDRGTIEAGRLADLVLLEANPLEDVRNTQRISAGSCGGAAISTPCCEAAQMADRNRTLKLHRPAPESPAPCARLGKKSGVRPPPA